MCPVTLGAGDYEQWLDSTPFDPAKVKYLLDSYPARREPRCTANCIGSDPLNLRKQLERFANEQWLPEHVTVEEATAIVLDQFKRIVTRSYHLEWREIRRGSAQGT